MTKWLELVGPSPRLVAAARHPRRQLHRWNVDMYSLLAFTGLNVWFRLLITHPTSDGSNWSIMCRDIAMTPAFPFPALVTSTTGTGSLIRTECTAEGGAACIRAITLPCVLTPIQERT